MKVQVDIAYHGMEPSPAIDENIRRRVAKLDRFAGEIIACNVVVDAPHRRQHKGKLYNVRIHLALRDGAVTADRVPDADHSHADMHVAIHHAFDAVLDQLTRREARRHPRPRHPGEGSHQALESFDA